MSKFPRPFLLTLAVCQLVLACGQVEEEPFSPPPRVKFFEVGTEALGQVRTISGQLASADTSPLAFGIAGTVDRVNVSRGDVVEEGKVLATLDPQPLKLSLQQARARLTSMRAKLVEAEQAYGRTSALWKQEATSQANVDVATANLKSARANMREARSAVEQQERDLKRVELRAPFAGKIADRSIDPFQEIRSNDPAFVLQGGDALIVRLQVPETLIRHVYYAQPVRVSFPTLDEVTQMGTVSLIGAQAEIGNAFPVEIQLPVSEEDLRPGMSAAVTFNFDQYLEGRTAYLIPLSSVAIDTIAVTGTTTHDYVAPVFVYDAESGQIRLREIRIGGLRGNQLEAYEGLEPGDRVISAGVPFLRDGMEVELWTSEQGLSDG